MWAEYETLKKLEEAYEKYPPKIKFNFLASCFISWQFKTIKISVYDQHKNENYAAMTEIKCIQDFTEIKRL